MEKKKRKVIQSEVRKIVAKVYHFLKEEYEFTRLYNDPNCDISHLRNATKRTSDATGVSVRTVQSILKEERELPSSSSEFPVPFKNRRKRANKVTVDARTADAVRGAMRDLHSQKQIPTLEKLSKILNENIGYDGCIATLRKLLKKMGYRWSKTESNKKVLVERHDFQLWRYEYLKKINEYRSQGRAIVYTDESYVTTTRLRNSTNTKDDQPPSYKPGARYVLIHAGTEAGFIDNACLVYKANAASGDIRPIISFEDYVKWLDDQLLPNLPDGSVIIINNASHNTHAEKMPTPQSDVPEMQAWLTSKGVPFDANLHRLELYDIVKKYKNAFTTYKIDNYVRSKGFEVLRLPPQHPELNAILYIWDTLKHYIGVIGDDIDNTKEVIKQGISQIPSEEWHNTCNYVIKKEIQYMTDFDANLGLIVNIRDDDDDEDGTVSEGSSEDST